MEDEFGYFLELDIPSMSGIVLKKRAEDGYLSL
jgi:hypothetical protein